MSFLIANIFYYGSRVENEKSLIQMANVPKLEYMCTRLS